MTEQIDLDALIAEARGRAGQDMGLSDQLLRELSDALESTLAELRQERERADEATEAAEDHVLDAEVVYERMSHKLSRALYERDEALAVISEVDACVMRARSGKSMRDIHGQLIVEARRILSRITDKEQTN